MLLWALGDVPHLSADHRTVMTGAAALFVSAASLWGIAIKRVFGKRTRTIAQARCRPLAMTWRHTETAGGLPPLHADPFDRPLIARVKVEPLTLATANPSIAAHAAETV